MINLNTYIIEKLKINKDVLDNKILNILDLYLNDMIITKEEKYIIKEIKDSIIKWSNENNINLETLSCYANKKDSDIIVNKIKDDEQIDIFNDIIFLNSDNYDKLYFKKVMDDENTYIYQKRMTNQHVKIYVFVPKNINKHRIFIGYDDSFLKSSLIFTNDEP